MGTFENTVNFTSLPVEGLPTPHRCPWWVQYMLVSPFRRLVEPPSRMLEPYVEPGMTVLEPGAGFGYVSMALAGIVGPNGRVVCVDIEPRAVARLEKKAKRAGYSERIQAFVCGNRDMGLASYIGQIDMVTVIHTLHEFEDMPGFLNQVISLLKPSGKMLVVEPCGHVKNEHFEAELKCCRLSGFRLLSRPDLGGRRMAALLAPPTISKGRQ